MSKENPNYNDANFQADDVVDKHVSKEIVRHVNCGCHQCTMRAKDLSEDWMFSVDPQDLVDWLEGANE